jgi:hypothetical protein
MALDLEYLYVNYPQSQYYEVGGPVSTMTTLFVWNEPPNFSKNWNKKRSVLEEDFLVCAPNSKDSVELKVFKIIEGGVILRNNEALI